MDIEQAFGRNVRTVRKERNLSQEELALEIGADQTYISRVEAGKKNISIQTIGRIAKALKVSTSELM